MEVPVGRDHSINASCVPRRLPAGGGGGWVEYMGAQIAWGLLECRLLPGAMKCAAGEGLECEPLRSVLRAASSGVCCVGLYSVFEASALPNALHDPQNPKDITRPQPKHCGIAAVRC